ncbi:DUF302 domain-containing protein [Thiohalorhabdus sp. Cl-TMA]|uniref:DUF302 domain-containing protein n=1 Tax=Thiohalorhabdus methylotrophus TaxID=3242694 RepID=A0ABV4TSM7_9GAMM
MYGFHTELPGEFETVRKQVIEALGKEGFGVLTEINVADTLKAKLDSDMAPYTILGACNPALAEQAIKADVDIGLLLPCNVVVRENEQGRQTVGFMDPEVILGITDNARLTKVAREVRERLERVRESLAG